MTTFNTTTPQQDFIDAGVGNDTVSSVFAELQQNDTINGGDGIDTLIITGGSAEDTISIDASDITNQLDIDGTKVTGFEDFDLSNFTGVVIFNGSTGNDSIESGNGDDVLSGDNGDDYLNGGAGIDALIGGRGNDTYVVDNLGDIVYEFLNSGIDTIQSSVTWTLKANLENLILIGTDTINGIGNKLNNTLTGNVADNQLSGNAGNDTLIGSAGNDTLNGGEGNDTADYSQIGQSITLSPTGIITKGGGLGNDQLIQVETIIADASAVNNTIDVSTAGNAASINVNLQTQQLTVNGVPGVGTFTVTNFDHVQGTSQNDTIIGDSQNNQLSGNAGNDTLNGSEGNDTLNGGTGNDTADYSQIGQSITLSPTQIITKGSGLGNDQLIQVETIIADASAVNNTIDVSTAGNTAAINVNLQTQQLTINGVGTFTVTNFDHVQGTSQNDTIIGDTQNNQLSGNAGNDTLNGGAGNDTLIGGTGDDIYIVDNTTDIITENLGEGTDTIRSGVTFTLTTNVENLTLTGTDAINGTGNDVNNIIVGNSANNIIIGNAGNDTLDGGDGSDALIGGIDDDIYIVDSTTDIITENLGEGTDTTQSSVTFSIATNVENLTLTGTAAINGTGNAGNNVITGNSANNTLNGGAGNDTLIGGTGDDIYVVDSTTDIITENGNAGTDSIQSSVTYTIAINVENLTLTGTAAINGTGNAGNNVITGNSDNNTLNGGAGNDTLIGGIGDDIYVVDSTTDTITENGNAGADTIQSSVTYTIATLTNVENLTLTGTTAINGTGNAGNNVITGNNANNVMIGNAGNDILDGGNGSDALIGGTGNDIYIVNSTTDTITENANEGTDTIQSSVTFTIATLTNIENLTLTGTAAISGTGNAGNNVITGNSANNTLNGGAGNDTLIGGTGDDIYIVDSVTDIITENANAGTDTIQSSVTFSIATLTNIENLTLTGIIAINGTGNAGNNVITGNSDNNTLNGGAGNDTLIGGTGDDIYVVDSTTDIITENGNAGTDTIQSSVTFSIATNVENLILTGTAAINATGNAGKNVITGNSANNTLDGGTGNDTLDGSGGIDALIGGTGNDIYIVNSTTDTITENANEGTDTIQSSVTFSIATLTNIENLTLRGTAAINGTGNAGNNIITGNGANNTLDGGAGNDTLIGGTGNDIYIVNSTTDTITENANEGTDTIQSSVTFSIATLTNVENLTLTGTTAINGTGNAGNNVITGNSANNTLNGGAGNDTLIGGTGDDIYIVDSVTDIITENANAGTDTIQSSVTYTIATNVENLTLTGIIAINGTGNAGNNIITGNSDNNTLNGGAGNDTLIGGAGDDIYIVDSITDIIAENANGGTDTIQSSVTFSIAALTNVENLTLTGTTAINGTGNAGNNIITGNNANNVIIGNAGNDTLDGGDGSDALIGGTGNDIYLVNSTTDTITENANGGTDTIQSSVTYTIATNVENLTLTGIIAINGTGNAGNNIITGNGVNNTLTGGVGKDTLTGGLGVDRFDYRTLADSVFSNFDVITDFSANTSNDLFLVSTARSGFSNAGTVATLDTNGIAAKLTTAAFTANSAAQFSFGSRSFVALNDVTAGFSATTDAIIEVTGLTGTLGLNNFTTSLV
jgi:Ca2+-binding RTX toxin-like protein